MSYKIINDVNSSKHSASERKEVIIEMEAHAAARKFKTMERLGTRGISSSLKRQNTIVRECTNTDRKCLCSEKLKSLTMK